jgi:L,D-transpeptidase ErfK/SrfK
LCPDLPEIRPGALKSHQTNGKSLGTQPAQDEALTLMRARFALLAIAFAISTELDAERLPGSVGHAVVSDVIKFVAGADETLISIAARLGVDPKALARRNGHWVYGTVRRGEALVADVHRIVPAGVELGMVINVPQRKLFARAPDGEVRAISIIPGPPEWPTPRGRFQQLARNGQAGAAHCVDEGAKWIGMRLVGMAVGGPRVRGNAITGTPGECIQVKAEHMAWLDPLLAGGGGEVIYEPVLVARDHDHVYAEVHADLYHSGIDPMTAIHAAIDYLHLGDRIDQARLREVVGNRAGVAVDVTSR